MALYKIIAIVLMIAPIAIICVGMKRIRTQPGDTLGLAIAAAGNFLFFILGWIASGQFLYALMASLALVIYICPKLKRGGIVGTYAVSTVAAIVAVGAAMISISIQSAGCEERNIRSSAQERGNIYLEAKTELVGKVLRGQFAERQALVILYDYSGSLSKRFRSGVGSGFDIVDIARELPPGPGQSEERWEWGESKTLAKQFDELLDGREDYDLVICFADLPTRPQDMQFWKRPAETRPDFVLVNQQGMVGRLQRGLVTGIVVNLPNIDAELVTALDSPDNRYTVKKLVAALAGTVAYVDRDNLAEITKKYPSLLH